MGASKHAVILLTVTLAGIAGAGTDQQVPSSQTGRQGVSGGQRRTDAEAVNLIGQKSELARRVQVLELDRAGIDARRKALQEQIVALRGSAGKGSADAGQLEEFTKELTRLAVEKAGKEAQLQVIRDQLEEVQQQLTQIAPVAPRTDAEAVNLGGQESELAQRTQVLELDLAGIDARQKALQEQIVAIRGTTDKESAGHGQVEDFTRELRRLAIDKAGREAQLQTVRRQLEQVQRQLAQAAPTAPRTDAEAVNLGGQKSELTRRAQALELDVAGIEARRQVLQEQIVMIRSGTGQESPGSGQREEFVRESSRLAIDKAGKEAQLQTVRRQLEQVQKQLTRALEAGR
jgi:chromosome segregation ATPase